MPTMNVRKGDTVKIMAGKDIGKQGKILHVYPSKERVVVEGINMVQKSLRPTQQNPQGGISHMESSVHVSNVMLVCPHCGKTTRVAHRIDTDGMKTRVCKKCGKDI